MSDDLNAPTDELVEQLRREIARLRDLVDLQTRGIDAAMQAMESCRSAMRALRLTSGRDLTVDQVINLLERAGVVTVDWDGNVFARSIGDATPLDAAADDSPVVWVHGIARSVPLTEDDQAS